MPRIRRGGYNETAARPWGWSPGPVRGEFVREAAGVMGLRKWLSSLTTRPPERPSAVVAFDEHGITCRWADGSAKSVAWDALRTIEIRTTDWGPLQEDVHLLLGTAEGGCVVPQGAEGFGELLERLQGLAGFDNRAVISAMTCTDNALFSCWRRVDA